MHNFAVYKLSGVEIKQEVRNLFNSGQSLQRAQLLQKIVRVNGIHLSADDTGRNRVESDTLACEFNRQCACDRLQTTFCQDGKTCRDACHRLACCDALMFTTWPDCCRRICSTASWEMWKKPERFVSVTTWNFPTVHSVKGLEIKNPGIVHEQINSSKALKGSGDHLPCSLPKSNVSVHQHQIGGTLQRHPLQAPNS